MEILGIILYFLSINSHFHAFLCFFRYDAHLYLSLLLSPTGGPIDRQTDTLTGRTTDGPTDRLNVEAAECGPIRWQTRGLAQVFRPTDGQTDN